MQTIIELLNNLTNPEWIIQYGGLYIVALIVFIESGLFFGFFLPGDPLLFIAGMIIANVLAPFSFPFINLFFWIVFIAVAGILGNYLGYWFGKKSGHLLFRKDNWLFKRKYLDQAKGFYEKRGGGAIVLARFLPVIRTFAPIVAGMVKMNKAKFSFYNIAGSLLWSGSILSAGFLLGENGWVKENLEKIIIGIVLFSTGPVIIKLFTGNKKPAIQTVPAIPSDQKSADLNK